MLRKKKKLYALRTYTTNTKKQLESKKKVLQETKTFYSIYTGFFFSIGPQTEKFNCREYFCDRIAGNFRKVPKTTVFYLIISGHDAKEIAKMRREVHRLEDALGYRRSRINCVTYKVCNDFSESVWQVDASPRWRHALPMFSYYLGELRNYCLGSDFTGSRLIHKVLKKNRPSQIFGPKVKDNWTNVSGCDGADTFEVELDSKRKKELKVT